MRPWVLSLVLARDAQDFFDRGLALEHPRQAVIADRGGELACVAFEFVLADTAVNHGAQGIVDQDQFVNAGPAAVTAAGIAARPIQRRGRVGWGETEQGPLVLAGGGGRKGVGP